MTSVDISQLRVPDALSGEDAADFLAAVEVSRQVRVSTWGNDDLAYTAEELLSICHDPYEWYVTLVARLGGTIVGRAGIAMPLDENTHLAHVTLDVLPSAQGHGIGRNLLEAAETFAKGENRKVVVVETNHPAATLSAGPGETLRAANGSGELSTGSREAMFAHLAGYTLEQVQQFGACRLPLAPEHAAALTAAARAAHGGAYRVHQWVDKCPDRWVDDLLGLEAELLPDGGDPGEALMTAEQLRAAEDLALGNGRHTLVTAAEHVETGKLVGLTTISVLGRRAEVVFQDDTLVLPQHRRREVGLLIKIANLALLDREFPQARTVYVWNATDNAHLLEVNERLGYVVAGMTGQWQKDLENH
ncbi:GNAT family N-acetyltransferase [Specibacter cremeus]|uniref:GNAT family N-acetyltransferase n=1 Tax=Specibacter cremeus TaxID=1629051 RepID=UPI000F7A1D48|nr:GNAT family N-acetyltransferase [Specibacter cremeus]